MNHAISLVSAAVAVLTLSVAAPAAEPALRKAAGQRLLIGAAVMSHHLDDPRRGTLIAEQFNCLTPENEMKPDALQRKKGTFTFDRADKLVTFARQHDMKVIGHTLVWHQQSPAWMFADPATNQPLSRDAALENLRAHIVAVMGHYKGKVHGWDVVNEAIGDSEPYLRDTPARKAIGDDYVVKAFQLAREADPAAELYYNDYNIEQAYKRPKALRLLRELVEAGVNVDGVGIQGHWLLTADVKEIDEGIKAIADLGLRVMITEMDIDPLPRRKGGGGGADLSATEGEGLDPHRGALPPELQRKLTDRYRELFAVFAKHPVTRVTFWGVDDGTSWLNNWPVRGRTNHPLLWDRQLNPKPALRAVIESLESQRQSDPK